MALNFPNSPANGENFVASNGVTYRWDGDKWDSITPYPTVGSGGGGGGGSGGGSTYKNVKTDFGAVGDGTTDDTTAVQNALNSGGGIYFPKGTYRITSTLTNSNAYKIIGDGQQSRIMFDANSNNQDFIVLEINERHNNNKKWMFNDISLTCKAVTGRIHRSGLRISYNGPATVIGGTNYLELTNVHIVSEMTTDATQAYFLRGLWAENCGGIVAQNLNISSFNANTENNSDSYAIYIENSKSGHAVIRAFTGTHIYLQRYYYGIYATKAGGGQNIESIYCTNGEIVANKTIVLEATHATSFTNLHLDSQTGAYINNSDGGPHRIVGCDLRSGRTGTANLSDYMIKLRANWTTMTGNVILGQMPSDGHIQVGGNSRSPLGIAITGNVFVGKGTSSYNALRCESGSQDITFGGNQFRDFGGNLNPVSNSAGAELSVYGQRSGNTV